VDKPDKQQLYLYAIRCGEFVKIGQSVDPLARFYELRVSSSKTKRPSDLSGKVLREAELLGYVPCDEHYEQTVHLLLQSETVHGDIRSSKCHSGTEWYCGKKTEEFILEVFGGNDAISPAPTRRRINATCTKANPCPPYAMCRSSRCWNRRK
jgi:hypothetical protein